MRRPLTQPRQPGVVRIPRHTSLLPLIDAAVKKEAKRWGVSEGFVRATCMAFALNIEDQPDYRALSPLPKKVIASRRFQRRRVG